MIFTVVDVPLESESAIADAVEISPGIEVAGTPVPPEAPLMAPEEAVLVFAEELPSLLPPADI